MNGISRKNYKPAIAAGSIRFGWAELPDDILKAMGGVFADWGFVEDQMDALLSVAVGHAGIGAVLRKEMNSSKQRRAVLAGLTDVASPSDFRARIAMIVGNFNRLAAERGLYAHGVWGVHAGYPGDAVLLLDQSVIRALHPDPKSISPGSLSFTDEIKMNTAVIRLEDLERFRASLKRLSDDLVEPIMELQHRQDIAKLRGG